MVIIIIIIYCYTTRVAHDTYMYIHKKIQSEVQTCIWPSRFHCHSLSLASVKSRLVLPFWYRLTWVVPDKGLLNGCVCVCVIVDTRSPFLYLDDAAVAGERGNN